MARFGDSDIVRVLPPPDGFQSWLAVPIKSLTDDEQIGNFMRELNEAREKAARLDTMRSRWASIDPAFRAEMFAKAGGLKVFMPQVWSTISVALDILRGLG